MLSRLPMRFALRFVTVRVCGMRLTVKSAVPTAATVRLMPSRATEPFSTMPRRISASAATVMRMAFPSSRMARIFPTPSMCPLTKCPPMRVVGSSARSRLSGAPRVSSASEVRRTVSGITSAEKPCASNEVTVRQMPFTAMLSPMCASDWTRCAPIESTPPERRANVPTSSMIPVNISSPHSAGVCRLPVTRRSAPTCSTCISWRCSAACGASKPTPPMGVGASIPPISIGAIKAQIRST